MGDVNQWQFPPNIAGKVVGWSDNGKELVNRSVDDISKVQTQFDKQGALYAASTYGTDAATKISGTLTGEHTQAKSLLHLEMVNEGSGLATGPSRAGYTFTAAAFKEGYPNLTAADGEIDTSLFTYRQVNGDVCAILGNGVIINGFGAFMEAASQSIDAVTFATKHSIQIHAAVVNDRDGGEWGYDCAKMAGQGGTAFYGYSATDAGWDYGLQLRHKGKTQLEQITANASLRIYQFDTPANYYDIRVIADVFTLTNSAGDKLGIATPVSVGYTPTATDADGADAPVAATISGEWEYASSKVRKVSIQATMTDIGAMTGAIRLTLPATAVNRGTCIKYWVGENLNTGATLRGRVLPNTAYVYVVKANDNSFPCVNGDLIYIAGEYETA